MNSYERVTDAIKNGKLKDNIVPVKLKSNKIFDEDAEYKRYNKDKISKLKPVFTKDGSVTGANASKINDGGCALVLMSEAKLKQQNLKPLARIVSYADTEVDPVDFCIAPATAIKIALKRAGLGIE